MFKKIVNKMKKLNQQNIYLPSNRIPRDQEESHDQESAEYEMINSMTNYKLILFHLKDQEQEQVKFLKLIKILAQEEIDIQQLKHVFYNYISYQYYTLRSLIWRVIIQYLPLRNNKWITKMEASKVHYQKLLLDNLISTIKRRPKEGEHKKIETEGVTMVVKASNDHPLNKNSNSTWNIYFKDHQLWTKIEKDMVRTRPKVKFFQEEHELELQTVQFQEPLHLSKNKRVSYHHDAVTRILFIYCKLNPQIGYSQGMNQIAALIYYAFTNKNSQYQRRVSQSDTYNVFCTIMNKLGPHHFAGKQAMNERIKLFCQALKKVDQKLYKIFEQNKIDLKLCCMRWIMIFMLQQFEINEAILVWDGLLCSEIGINKYIYYYCLSVMVIKRDELMENPTSIYGELKIKPKELLETSLHLYKQYRHLFG